MATNLDAWMEMPMARDGWVDNPSLGIALTFQRLIFQLPNQLGTVGSAG